MEDVAASSTFFIINKQSLPQINQKVSFSCYYYFKVKQINNHQAILSSV